MIFYRDGLEEEIDGRPLVRYTREGHLVEEYKVNGKTKYFVTLSGTHYCAHGETLAEAISDATWKDKSKRPSIEALKEEINEAGKSRKITLNEFRVLTGACAEGCRVALKRKGLDESPMVGPDILKHFPEWGGRLYEVLEWEKEVTDEI